MKPCPKCGLAKVFAKWQSRWRWVCLPCRRAKRREWEKTNVERVRAKNAAWQAAHRDELRAKNAAFRAANRETVRAWSRRGGWKRQGFLFTMPGYASLLAAQDGKCAICRTITPGGNSTVFVVDHDHEFKQVRGLLCHWCNHGLGRFRDSPQLLRAAAQYLDAHRPQLKLAANDRGDNR